MDFIPPSIAGLFDLETFLYKRSSGKVVKVPSCMCDMEKLRHVHINDIASFDLDSAELENSSILENLQTFSTPSLTYGDNMEKVLRKLQGIRKLKCIFLDSWDKASNCNKFPKLEFLSQLVSLNALYEGTGKYPCEFNFPSNLKKLTLSNFGIPWDEILRLTKLSNLEILKLLCNACVGERWQMEDEVFSKLRFLKLDTLDFVKWSEVNGSPYTK